MAMELNPWLTGVAMKTFPHHYSTSSSLDCWHGALWCWCEFLTRPSASLCRGCVFLFFSFLLARARCNSVFLCMWAPTVVAHPRHGWMFVNSEILFVLTIVIKICYPSSFSPSVSSNQSDQSPLAFHQQDIFFSKTTAHWMLLSFLSFFSVVFSCFSHSAEQTRTVALRSPRRWAVL